MNLEELKLDCRNIDILKLSYLYDILKKLKIKTYRKTLNEFLDYKLLYGVGSYIHFHGRDQEVLNGVLGSKKMECTIEEFINAALIYKGYQPLPIYKLTNMEPIELLSINSPVLVPPPPVEILPNEIPSEIKEKCPNFESQLVLLKNLALELGFEANIILIPMKQ